MVKSSRKVRGFAAKGVRQIDGTRRLCGRLDPESHLSSFSRVKEIRRVVFWRPKAVEATGAARLRGLALAQW